MHLSILASDAAAASGDGYASFHTPVWVWVAFVTVIVGLLMVDLLMIHRTAHVVSIKAAAIETVFWTVLGVLFVGVMYAWQGSQAAGEYFAGFLIEQSLSIDNVFVWAMIMSYFKVPREYQFRVLFYGILGALILRFIFIFTGVALLERFEWMLFVFGGFLMVTALRMLRHQDDGVDPDQNPVLRLVRKVIPSTTEYHGQKLFVRHKGKLLATPLFAVLIVVESSDVVFAVDSIPAILAVSREQFIVFSSNAFAILGLRALYFLLADIREKFIYLQQGLAVILSYVGFKMIISHWYHINTWVSLGVICVVFTVAILISWIKTRGEEDEEGAGPAGDAGAEPDTGPDTATAADPDPDPERAEITGPN